MRTRPLAQRPRRWRRAFAAALAVAASALALVSGSGAAPAPSPAAEAAAAENGFALSLLRHLGGGNVVFSPYSVATALAMAGAGARGTTATQIAAALGAPSSAALIADAGALRQALAAASAGGAGAPTLDVANALWTQDGLALEHPFVATLGSAFGAPPLRADFAGAPQAALQTINAWVSGHTNGIIPSILPEGAITPAVRFVLANAIYLKARWSTPFNPGATSARPFTTATGARVSAPFMAATDVLFPYAAGRGFEAVDLPYRSSSLSLLAILPVGESLSTLERSLTAASLAQLTSALRARPVDLLLPKLDLHTATSLNAPLQALGVTDAFGPLANFSAITTQAALRIGLVQHAAALRVDEQGTVAAGATVIVGPTAVALPPGHPIDVDFDHPYLLALREDRSGALLFVAQVADPGAG